MSSLLDRALPDGRRIADIAFAPVDAQKRILNFIDVGARNGSYILPNAYAARSRLIGFEPNRVEYEKLVNDRTDAKAAGLVEPPFRERKYFPTAVWSSDGERPIYITAGPGAVTLMGPVDRQMTQNLYREQDRGQNFYDRVQKLVRTDTVSCQTLDHIWSDRAEQIDILKLDAEGGELDILEGAAGLLREKRILLIISEFLLAPYYERRVTLGHQQVLLDAAGYRAIALDLNHSPYSWRRTSIEPRNDRWLRSTGDAIFVLDPDRNTLEAETMHRLGLACLAMGFNAFGLNLIREAGSLRGADIDAIEAEANRPPLKRRLRLAWECMPDAAAKVLGRLRRWR